MTIDDLKREAYFQQLTEGQQKFVVALCEGKTKKEAAYAGWNHKSDSSAISAAYKAVKHPNIKWLLAKFFDVGPTHVVPTRDELAAWNWSKAQTVNDPALAIKYAANVAKILGFETKPSEAPTEQKPDDGDEEFNL